MTTPQTPQLPPLPEPEGYACALDKTKTRNFSTYTREQMNAHYIKGYNDARAALDAQKAEQEPATRPANSQEWAGMGGDIAFQLIERHADGWGDVKLMMDEWLAANQTSAPDHIPDAGKMAAAPEWRRHGGGHSEWWSWGKWSARHEYGFWVLRDGDQIAYRHDNLQTVMDKASAKAEPDDHVAIVPRVWRNALRKLAFMARTSGGTTGPDNGLMDAIGDAESLLRAPYRYTDATVMGAAPELVGQWLPIESAPDDMTRCVVVRWTDAEGQEHTDLDYKEDGCWMGWHEHAEHVQMIGGHGVSHTLPYAQWLQLPPADGAAMAGQPEKGSQP